MKRKVIFELLKDIVDQALGIQPKKEGKLGLTFYGLKRMEENNLTLKDLEEVFHYGEQVNPEMQVRQYNNYTIGITYKYHQGDNRYMIITCWNERTGIRQKGNYQ